MGTEPRRIALETLARARTAGWCQLRPAWAMSGLWGGREAGFSRLQRAFNFELCDLLRRLVEKRLPPAPEEARGWLRARLEPRAAEVSLYAREALPRALRGVVAPQCQWNAQVLSTLTSARRGASLLALAPLTQGSVLLMGPVFSGQARFNVLLSGLLHWLAVDAVHPRAFWTQGTLHTAGYAIPEGLVGLTGGAADTWEAVTHEHLRAYERLAPLQPGHSVLEVGCGVGRDAIALTQHLSREGRYLGLDLIAPSIRWCQEHITPRHPHFRFAHLDVHSLLHNPSGTRRVTDVRLPLEDGSVDRILLQSVFTHMFRDGIVHYLREFRRVLRPEGRVVATLFLLDARARRHVATTPGPLSFSYPHGEGCFVNELHLPEAAVAYSDEALLAMLSEAGLVLARPIARGRWSGHAEAEHGEDIVLLQRP